MPTSALSRLYSPSVSVIYARRSVFFFNGTATPAIYTLSLHDALPICPGETATVAVALGAIPPGAAFATIDLISEGVDRKSTRLNSSHANISYAVFCLKKKTNQPARVVLLSPITARPDRRRGTRQLARS